MLGIGRWAWWLGMAGVWKCQQLIDLSGRSLLLLFFPYGRTHHDCGVGFLFFKAAPAHLLLPDCLTVVASLLPPAAAPRVTTCTIFYLPRRPEVCARLAARQPQLAVPIIMVSAHSEEAMVVRGLDAGAVDYITKPFKRAEFLARIRAKLNLSSDSQGEAAQQVRLGGLVRV